MSMAMVRRPKLRVEGKAAVPGLKSGHFSVDFTDPI